MYAPFNIGGGGSGEGMGGFSSVQDAVDGWPVVPGSYP